MEYLSAKTSSVFSVICILMWVYGAYTLEISDLTKECQALAASLTSVKSVDICVIWCRLVSYTIMAEAEGSSTGAKTKEIQSQESMQSKRGMMRSSPQNRSNTWCSFYSVDGAEKPEFSTHAQLPFFLINRHKIFAFVACLFCKNVPE